LQWLFTVNIFLGITIIILFFIIVVVIIIITFITILMGLKQKFLCPTSSINAPNPHFYAYADFA